MHDIIYGKLSSLSVNHFMHGVTVRRQQQYMEMEVSTALYNSS
jgi:hypothetical protein